MVYFLPIRFAYDPAKSAANKARHGIDFEEAQALWDDARAISNPVVGHHEARFLITGRIGEKYWTAVVAYRRQRIRMISVRRARRDETEDYLRRGV